MNHVKELKDEELERVSGGAKTESSDVVQTDWKEMSDIDASWKMCSSFCFASSCPSSKNACCYCEHFHEVNGTYPHKFYCDLGIYPDKQAYMA